MRLHPDILTLPHTLYALVRVRARVRSNCRQVSTSLYASYYFQLRTLCQRENNGQEPALKPMDMEKAQALEARGLSKTAELKKSAGKTWQSANDVDSSAAGGLGSLAGAVMRGPL